jgi:hypothetical protein
MVVVDVTLQHCNYAAHYIFCHEYINWGYLEWQEFAAEYLHLTHTLKFKAVCFKI